MLIYTTRPREKKVKDDQSETLLICNQLKVNNLSGEISDVLMCNTITPLKHIKVQNLLGILVSPQLENLFK